MTRSPVPGDGGLEWYALSDPITAEQYDQLPPGRPGICGRTKPVWVRYRHTERRQIVISKGVFDHEAGYWMARYYPVDDGDRVCRVEAIAWAKIVPRFRPEGAPVIVTPPGADI
jgi:hypothetical protein